ncbi:MAG: T9SS type A sorting domain-containing protein [Bacteroidota bacterium]|jgi:plastocyanin
MKTQSISVFQRTTSILWVVVLLAVVTTAHATTHVIQFGGTFGFTYSPNSLNVSVGDTVMWQGDFVMHPLSSTSVPAGASSFHQASGSVFTCPVTVAGAYLYQCDFHFSIGMTGSFTASKATGIENDQTSLRPNAFKLGQNFPNPFNPTTTISFDIPFQTYISIKVYNLTGQEMATIVSENMAAGNYSKIWNAAVLPSGVYFYRLQTGSFTDIRKLVLIK